MTTKGQVRTTFSDRASLWAAQSADTEQRTVEARNLASRRRFALQMLQAAVPRGAKILDAGCGPGEISAALIESGYDAWGVDIAEPMIRHARERCRSDQFRIGDIERIPFQDSTFDAVVCLGVIEYLDADQQALTEMRRVLRPGGTAVISTPNAACPLQNIDRALFALTCALQPATPQGNTYRRYHRHQWLRLLRSIGFHADEFLCYGWGWYRSPHIALLIQLLSRNLMRLQSASFLRAIDRFVRNPMFNWLAAEQMVRLRATK